MSSKDIESLLRRKTRSTRSTESIISLSHWLRERDIGPNHDGLKRAEIEQEAGDQLDYSVSTVLTHLVDADIVEKFIPPGPEVFVIAEWRDDGDGEIVNGEVGEAAQEGLEALAEEVETDDFDSGSTAAATDGSGPTLRGVLATEFALVPGKVEEFLRTTNQPVDTLIDAVEAIEEADEELQVGEGYGDITFINTPNRYRLTEKAVGLYEK